MLRKRRQVDLGDGRGAVSMNEGELQRASTDVLSRIAQQLNDPKQQRAAVDELVKMAQMIQYVKDPMAIAKAGLGVNFVGKRLEEVFMNGLLSSPDTLVANASGAAWTPLRFYMEGVGARMMQMVAPELGRQQWIEASAKISAMHQAIGDAARLSWQGMLDNRFMYADPGAERVTNQAIRGANAQAFAERNGFKIDEGMSSFIDAAGAVINYPGRALLTADEFARHLALRGEVAGRAVRKAAGRGIDLKSKEAMDKVVQKEFKEAFSLDPETGRDWFYSDAYDVASALDPGGKAISNAVKESVFQEDNAAAAWLSEGIAKYVPALQPMVPFVRTPANILKQGIKETTSWPVAARWWCSEEQHPVANRDDPRHPETDAQQPGRHRKDHGADHSHDGGHGDALQPSRAREHRWWWPCSLYGVRRGPKGADGMGEEQHALQRPMGWQVDSL